MYDLSTGPLDKVGTAGPVGFLKPGDIQRLTMSLSAAGYAKEMVSTCTPDTSGSGLLSGLTRSWIRKDGLEGSSTTEKTKIMLARLTRSQ